MDNRDGRVGSGAALVRTEYATWTSLIGAVRALGPQADMQSTGVIIGGEQVREAEQMVRGVTWSQWIPCILFVRQRSRGRCWPAFTVEPQLGGKGGMAKDKNKYLRGSPEFIWVRALSSRDLLYCLPGAWPAAASTGSGNTRRDKQVDIFRFATCWCCGQDQIQ